MKAFSNHTLNQKMLFACVVLWLLAFLLTYI